MSQGVHRLAQFKFWTADFHSLSLSSIQNLSRVLNAVRQFIYARTYESCCHKSLITLFVTTDADAFRSRPDHLLRWLQDVVIVVTSYAFAYRHLVELGLMLAGLKELSLTY